MNPIRMLLAAALTATFVTPVLAQQQGRFVVMLGQDTTGAEQYTRTADRLVVEQLGRAPRTLRRHFEYDFRNGALEHFRMVVAPPGSTTPTQTIEASFDADSMRAKITTGTNAAQDLRVAVPRGALVVAASSPWSNYETRVMQLVKSKADTSGGVMYFIGAATVDRFHLSRLGRDSVQITNAHGDEYRVRVDKSGALLGSRPVAGTQKFSITRVGSLDLDALGASYLAREQAGAGLGVLSPRDSLKVTAGGAALYVDYGRPAKRGRTVYGGIVPYGEVWRTGANAATQFRTDKTLVIGGQTLPAGFYTLWTLPSANGWKLIVNSETGQWGTAHKPEKDLLSVDMQVTTLPAVVEHFTIGIEPGADGGTLNLDWDTTRASVAFKVQP